MCGNYLVVLRVILRELCTSFSFSFYEGNKKEAQVFESDIENHIKPEFLKGIENQILERKNKTM